MLKIFLTGDNHIGLRYANHEKSAALVWVRLNAFMGMVEKANAEGCDLFVCTGDLLDNTYNIAKKDVDSLLHMLSEFSGTVVMLPGNHDYFDRDSKVVSYFMEVASLYDNILLLTDYRPYELTVRDENVVIYPALCKSLHSAPGENNIGWIKELAITADSTYRLGIAHGAVEGETIDREGQYFLMTRDELESIPVDAWLIGHTHVPFPADLSETEWKTGERIFNPGTHTQTDVSCNTEGWCFILEIEEGSGLKPVKAKKFHSGQQRFYRREVEVRPGKLEAAVNAAVKEMENRSVVELILRGAATFQEYEKRDQILGKALARFLEGSYNDIALSKAVSRNLIDAEFPETSFSAGFLKALLDEPREAQLAYELLKSMKEGK